MPKKVELETLAENRLVHRPDFTLPRRAGIGDNDIDSTEGRADTIERPPNRSTIGNITGRCDAADLIAEPCC